MIGDLLSNLSAANRLSIEQIQRAVQDGTLPAYVGIPVLQQKLQQRQQAAALLAGKQVAGQPPIGQQIMDQASQAIRGAAPTISPSQFAAPQPPQQAAPQPAPQDQGQGQGLDSMPTNLPAQGFAPGGIVAFAKGNVVEDQEAAPLGSLFGTIGSGLTYIPRKVYGAADTAIQAGAQGLGNYLLGTVNALDPNASVKVSPSTGINPLDPTAYSDEGAGMPAKAIASAVSRPIKPTAAKPAEAPTPFDESHFFGMRTPTTTPSEEPTQESQDQATPSSIAASIPSTGEGIEGLQKEWAAQKQKLYDTITGNEEEHQKNLETNMWLQLLKGGLGMMGGASPIMAQNVAAGAGQAVSGITDVLQKEQARKDAVTQRLLDLGYRGAEMDMQLKKLGIEKGLGDAQIQHLMAQTSSIQQMTPVQIANLKSEIQNRRDLTDIQKARSIAEIDEIRNGRIPLMRAQTAYELQKPSIERQKISTTGNVYALRQNALTTKGVMAAQQEWDKNYKDSAEMEAMKLFPKDPLQRQFHINKARSTFMKQRTAELGMGDDLDNVRSVYDLLGTP